MNPTRLFRLDDEIDATKNYSTTPYGLEDPDDITRTNFVGSLIVGDNIIQIEFKCTEQYPEEPPQVKFGKMVREKYSSIRKICDENGNLRKDLSFITDYDSSQSIGRFLGKIRSYIENY
jgi:hypothetical protein